MNTQKLTILYDIKREGSYRVDITESSYVARDRYGYVIDLLNDGFIKEIKTKSPYHRRFKMTPKGNKYLKEYEAEYFREKSQDMSGDVRMPSFMRV